MLTDKRGIRLTAKPHKGEAYRTNQWLLDNANSVANAIGDTKSEWRNWKADQMTAAQTHELTVYLFGETKND